MSNNITTRREQLAELRALAHEVAATDELLSEEMRQIALETAEELFQEWKADTDWGISA